MRGEGEDGPVGVLRLQRSLETWQACRTAAVPGCRLRCALVLRSLALDVAHPQSSIRVVAEGCETGADEFLSALAWHPCRSPVRPPALPAQTLLACFYGSCAQVGGQRRGTCCRAVRPACLPVLRCSLPAWAARRCPCSSGRVRCKPSLSFPLPHQPSNPPHPSLLGQARSPSGGLWSHCLPPGTARPRWRSCRPAAWHKSPRTGPARKK